MGDYASRDDLLRANITRRLDAAVAEALASQPFDIDVNELIRGRAGEPVSDRAQAVLDAYYDRAATSPELRQKVAEALDRPEESTLWADEWELAMENMG